MTWRTAVLTVAMALGVCTQSAAQAIPADFSVTLSRTRCFGTCPVYSVTIDARGKVSYEGSLFVRVEGKQTATIPISRVAELANAVDRIGFFKLDSKYEALAEDFPTTYVTVTKNSRRKQIKDYAAGPPALTGFEQLIDTVANTRKWVRIDGPTLQGMFDSGRPPSVTEQSDFLLHAMGNDDIDVVEVLLAHGLDVNRPLSKRPLIHLARSPEMVAILKRAGADMTARTDEGNALMAAMDYGQALTKALLDAGVPADVASNEGYTPLLSASCYGNAEVVALLLAAGANPDTRSNNTTALECAEKEARDEWVRSFHLEYMFKQDYEEVIRLLKLAIAKRKPQ